MIFKREDLTDWAERDLGKFYFGDKGDRMPDSCSPDTLIILRDGDNYSVYHPYTQITIDVPITKKWLQMAEAFKMTPKFMNNKILNIVMTFLKEHAPDIHNCFTTKKIESPKDVKLLT